jgi:hypothetical protein
MAFHNLTFLLADRWDKIRRIQIPEHFRLSGTLAFITRTYAMFLPDTPFPLAYVASPLAHSANDGASGG